MTTELSPLYIQTERLVLRPWRRDDLSIMREWTPFTDPLEQLWNWTTQLTTISLDFFFAAHVADRTQHVWTLLADDIVSGLVMLQTRDPTHATLGISLKESAQGRGYGREALSALLDASFRYRPRASIRLEVALANKRALALYRALHFGEIRRFWRDAGVPQQYAFLDAPRYQDVQPLFRRTNTAMYQLCAEMELRAETWGRFVV